MTKPGTTNFPTVFTCFAPISARAFTIFEQSDFFISDAVAKASAIPPFERALPAALGAALSAFIAFTVFIAFIAFIVEVTFIAAARTAMAVKSRQLLEDRV